MYAVKLVSDSWTNEEVTRVTHLLFDTQGHMGVFPTKVTLIKNGIN